MENGNSPDMLATCQTLRFFCPLPWKSFKAGEKQGGGGVMYHPCQIDIACSSQWIELPACGDCIVVLAPDRNFPHSALVEVLNVEMSRFPIKVITIRGTHLWHGLGFRQSNSNIYWIPFRWLPWLGKYFATWKAIKHMTAYISLCAHFTRMHLMCHISARNPSQNCEQLACQRHHSSFQDTLQRILIKFVLKKRQGLLNIWFLDERIKMYF